MFRRATLVLVFISVVSSCSDFPELDDAVDSDAHDARYPDLVPIEDIYAGIPEAQIDDETTMDVEARIARLKARAARLRGTVIDSHTRKRLKDGVT